MKRHLNLALHGHLRDVLDLEAEAMMYTGRSEDFREGTKAFLSKQKAKFTGRWRAPRAGLLSLRR